MARKSLRSCGHMRAEAAAPAILVANTSISMGSPTYRLLQTEGTRLASTEAIFRHVSPGMITQNALIVVTAR